MADAAGAARSFCFPASRSAFIPSPLPWRSSIPTAASGWVHVVDHDGFAALGPNAVICRAVLIHGRCRRSGASLRPGEWRFTNPRRPVHGLTLDSLTTRRIFHCAGATAQRSLDYPLWVTRTDTERS
jgi:hypothetical protein